MTRTCLPKPTGVALGLLIAASCAPADSSSSDPGAGPERTLESTEIFEADKEIAKALSIGQSQLQSQESTPYGQALLCSVALESVVATLSERGKAGQPELAQIADAFEIYSRRADQSGKDLGKTDAEVARDRAGRAAQVPELRDRAVISIGCMRDL